MSITALATPYQYSQLFNRTLTAIDITRLESMLEYSSEVIERNLDRQLATQTINEWYKQDYSYDKNVIYTKEYPIKYLKQVALPGPVATIINTDQASTNPSVSIFPTETILASLTWYDSDGDLQEVDILQADCKKMSTFKTSVELNTGWQMDIDPVYVNWSTSLLKPIGLQQAGVSKVDLLAGIDQGLDAEITVENEVRLSAEIDYVYLRYVSGYDVAVDAEDHLSLVSEGEMPKDIVMVVCNVANDLMSLQTTSLDGGNPNGMLKSESIGDYSYTRFDNATINAVVDKYSSILNRYRRISFVQ